MSRLFNKAKPQSYEDSRRNITSAINGLKILKKKKLKRNLTDLQVETVISQALLPTDQSEFILDWAKEKSSSVLSSTMIEPGEDDGEEEEELVDFDKTSAGKLDVKALEAKRDFLIKFLSRKLVELSEILASRRIRNFGRKETTGTTKYVKFKDKLTFVFG